MCVWIITIILTNCFYLSELVGVFYCDVGCFSWSTMVQCTYLDSPRIFSHSMGIGLGMLIRLEVLIFIS